MKTRASACALLLLLATTACTSTTGEKNASGGPAAAVVKPCRPGEERTAGGIVFVRLCAGTFTMGSAEGEPGSYVNERPAHPVTLSEYWLAKTETTNAQYRGFRPDHPGEPELPAVNVSWDDAKAACAHFGGRLPTEAQWEYAARAGTTTFWSSGDDPAVLGEHAWYEDNSGNKPQPVGTKKPNAWGLHDLHGNVWEWVADSFGPYPATALTDPTGPAEGEVRVVRGGSAFNPPRALRSAFRQWMVPVVRKDNFGFRCVLDPEPTP